MTKQRMARMALVLGLIFSLSACGSARAASGPQTGPGTQTAETAAKTADTEMTSPAGTTEEVQKTMLQMKIGETKVSVSWAQSPIPNPQSPIPNPQSPYDNLIEYKIIF